MKFTTPSRAVRYLLSLERDSARLGETNKKSYCSFVTLRGAPFYTPKDKMDAFVRCRKLSEKIRETEKF